MHELESTPESAQTVWRAQVAAVLKKSGKLGPEDTRPDPESLLVSRSYEQLVIKPLYTSDDAPSETSAHRLAQQAAVRRPDAHGWDVRTLHAGTDVAAARRAVLKDLENGASSVWLRLGDAGLPLGCLAEVLADVYLDLAPVSLDAGARALHAAKEFVAVCTQRAVPCASVRGDLGCDPYGLLARQGQRLDLDEVCALALRVAPQFPGLRTFVVDSGVFHEAGGSDAQELGMSMAVGVAYLRALVDAGASLDVAASQVAFRYAVAGDQFLGLAKLRAARLLWRRICEVAGVSDSANFQVQHAVTSFAMMSQRDPWTNMLRTTVAAFAAGVGGADAVTVLPFDAALGQSDDFARRIARGTQALLLEEANLGRVGDPAGGSWYVESLTHALAEAAWAEFQTLERAGGWMAAWSQGLPQTALAATWAQRAKNIARRKDPQTGVSEFPALGETALHRQAVPAVAVGHEQRLGVHRYAEAFERLRDRSDAQLALRGSRPSVLLLTVGDEASHTARATFMTNLLQAGGIEAVRSGPIHSSEALDAALVGGGPPVVCVCGSDKDYAKHGAWVLSALQSHGVKHRVLAGKETLLQGVGASADSYVFAGADMVEFLESMAQKLEGE